MNPEIKIAIQEDKTEKEKILFTFKSEENYNQQVKTALKYMKNPWRR